jgi:hypothetical protein
LDVAIDVNCGVADASSCIELVGLSLYVIRNPETGIRGPQDYSLLSKVYTLETDRHRQAGLRPISSQATPLRSHMIPHCWLKLFWYALHCILSEDFWELSRKVLGLKDDTGFVV